MANLGRKDNIYFVRFRFQGKEYKQSLKIRDRTEAETARRIVEVTIHRLSTRQLMVPNGVDTADFIVSGGTVLKPTQTSMPSPMTRQLIVDYLETQKHYLADSTHKLFTIHLNHWLKTLGQRAERAIDTVVARDLEQQLAARIVASSATTAAKERRTLRHFFKWAANNGYVSVSPATDLPVITCGEDRPRFRTIAEVEEVIVRGGTTKEQVLDIWECVYLTPAEIASILGVVRERASEGESLILHAVPAYTGMRRGEVVRLPWIDVDIERGFVTAAVENNLEPRPSRHGRLTYTQNYVRSWKTGESNGPRVNLY